MTQSVLLAIEAGVATIAFNRPEVFNAMDGEMMIRFRAAAELAQKDPAIRAIVLRGEGKSFLAGGDVGAFHRHIEELPDLIVRWGRELHFALLALRRAPKPVLASVHGAIAGAGFSVLCVADLAVSADDARFSLAYANIGTSPDGGSTHFLPRLVGPSKALELFLGADLVGAAEAQRLRLVNRVVPAAELPEATRAWARQIAAAPPLAVKRAKRALQLSERATLEEMLDYELDAQLACFRSADGKEGIAAFFEKRTPHFTGR